jgi:hypothetical protein
MRYFPEAQSDPSIAWRVKDALAAAVFSEWSKFKLGTSQDMLCSASQYSRKAHGRDTRYAKVSHLPFLSQSTTDPVQYEVFDMPVFQSSNRHDPLRLYYGRLEHLVSVEFSEDYMDLQLPKGTTVAFALFRQCILTGQDPQLDRLNIHLYSKEDENLQATEVSCIHGLVGRVKDGQSSWAIIDRSGGFSREAYLTHEAS